MIPVTLRVLKLTLLLDTVCSLIYVLLGSNRSCLIFGREAVLKIMERPSGFVTRGPRHAQKLFNLWSRSCSLKIMERPSNLALIELHRLHQRRGRPPP
jgi:hypothetical protein